MNRYTWDFSTKLPLQNESSNYCLFFFILIDIIQNIKTSVLYKSFRDLLVKKKKQKSFRFSRFIYLYLFMSLSILFLSLYPYYHVRTIIYLTKILFKIFATMQALRRILITLIAAKHCSNDEQWNNEISAKIKVFFSFFLRSFF